MGDKAKNLIILFPGMGYNVSNPLFYYARIKYAAKGFEIMETNYGDCILKDRSFDENIEAVKVYVLNQIKSADLAAYDNVLFFSKSYGTVVAGLLENEVSVKVRHVFLTPLNGTLPFIAKGKNIDIVIAGTNDKYMEADNIKAHCEREGIRLELIAGADHSLVIHGDARASVDALKKAVDLF